MLKMHYSFQSIIMCLSFVVDFKRIIKLAVACAKYLKLATLMLIPCSNSQLKVRTLLDLFSRFATTGSTISDNQIQDALHAIDLYPSKSQVHGLLRCACDLAGGREPADRLTFGEFCVLVTELRESYSRNALPPRPLSLPLEERTKHILEERINRGVPVSGETTEIKKVFLGGSCGPTQWRKDTAIPALEKHQITYFDPVVKEWTEKQVAIEDRAKQAAQILFFYIDNQTRSTTSMVESAYLAGCDREILLVINPLGKSMTVNQEEVSDKELAYLKRRHEYLTNLMESMRYPVFTNIDVALKCTAKVASGEKSVCGLTVDDGVNQVKFPFIRANATLLTLKAAFNNSGTKKNVDEISGEDLELAYHMGTGKHLPAEFRSNAGNNSFTFEELCIVASEFAHKKSGGRVNPYTMTGGIKIPDSSKTITVRDVYLGGTSGSNSWRQDVAIPILRQHGLSYYDPGEPKKSTRYPSLEAAIRNRCRCLVFVISKDRRGLASMMEAGHYIGRRCNVVLCLEQHPEGTSVEGEVLTANALKDYNRTRIYLEDLAKHDGVPVCSTPKEAIEACVNRLLALKVKM